METKTVMDFPTQLLKTDMEWDDLILSSKTQADLNEIKRWLKHNNTFLREWNMKGKIKPGYRVLFQGSPGTGKTLTAALLGKHINKDVFHIDLSAVISKYIGETEKNLSNLFHRAENKNWILFFDEADALFGKRTKISDAHDRYANQEVSYFLRLVEGYEGLVILSSNTKKKIDPAFTRRFNSIVNFKKPGISERLRLWKNYIPSTIKLDNEEILEQIAARYKVTGANIVNVIHYAGLKAIEKDVNFIESKYILKGIKKEFQKEGKVLPKK
jgi:SpoVK/Ycf46/Vps4 family AAA+-type ATPase